MASEWQNEKKNNRDGYSVIGQTKAFFDENDVAFLVHDVIG